jgi:hypothetical protein
MELELTVLEGGRLTWQGSAVHGAPVELTAGSIVRASCRYQQGQVALEKILEVLHRAQAGDGTLHSLASRGLFAEVVSATAGSEAPDALGFRGRALIELGRLTEGVEVLQRALLNGGPTCEVDAWNSPWASWAELVFEQKREVISRPFLTAVTRWAWGAAGRAPGSFLHPALHVLAQARPQDLSSPPFHAGGPAPVVFDARVLGAAVMPWLHGSLVGASYERERLIVEAVLAADFSTVESLSGPVAEPLKRAVQALAHAARTGELDLAGVTGALASLPGALSALTAALDLAEFATIVREPEVIDQVERVVFRGFVSVRRPPVIVIARQRDGVWLTVVQRKGLQLTRGTLDDAIAAVPELHFELAIAATADHR